MLSLLSFIIAVSGIGHAISKQMLPRPLSLLLAFPIGALLNALAMVLLTILSVPLSFWTIIGGNMVVGIILLISIKPFIKPKVSNIIVTKRPLFVPKALTYIGVVTLSLVGVYAVVHTLLPTFHYDSMTNWNMRSKVSYHRAEVVFDKADGLLEKPQYPVLYHALQVGAVSLAEHWSDVPANAVHLWLAICLFGSVGYLLYEQMGIRTAVVVSTLILGMPLLSLHTGQTYADITLVGYAILSLMFFARSSYLASAICVAACVWTKSEGLIFCLVPWLCMYTLRKRSSDTPLFPPVLATGFSAIWPVFAIANSLALTPHGGADTSITPSLAAAAAALQAMFVSGSFGITWYVLLPVTAFLLWKQHTIHDITLFAWGLLSLVGYLLLYTVTPNADYLLLGQSFDRQMLLPACLLILACALHMHKNHNVLTR